MTSINPGDPSKGRGRRPGRPASAKTGRNDRGRSDSRSSTRRKPGRSGSGRGRPGPTAASVSPAEIGRLPRWVRDELGQVTRRERREAALAALAAGADAFEEGRFGAAHARLREAKELSPRSPTIRELLGLAAYRVGEWREALRELRTYRRMKGDTEHMAVEMDCLRALGRSGDVEGVWRELNDLGGSQTARKEASVVFGANLLDLGEPRRAWDVVKPGRLVRDPSEADLRQWYVAARAAVALGDLATAAQITRAIGAADPDFPGLDELAGSLA